MTFELVHGDRRLGGALLRGWRRRCPRCGRGALFAGYVRVAARCGGCREAFHHHRADDLPQYFTILIVGHLIMPPLLMVEQAWQPAVWLQFAVWLPLSLGLTLALLPRIKGAVVGLQWAKRMHGFGAFDD